MKNRFVKYLFIAWLVVLVGSCSEELQYYTDVVNESTTDKIIMNVSLSIPDFQISNTRAFSETPDYNNLKLYVVEFQLGEKPLEGSTFTVNYTDSIKDEGVNADDGDIHFSIIIDQTFEPRVLHFIAVPKDYDLTIPYGLEGISIPNLVVSGDVPAYWHRIEFPEGYGYLDDEDKFQTHAYLKSKFEHVPMVCNFSRISLRVSDPDFILDGFAVLNQPTRGYIAPWDAAESVFPAFLNGSALLPYQTIDATYEGRSPGNNVTQSDATTAVYSTVDKYIYERQASSINNPMVIMRGRKTGDAPTTMRYYKLDIGYTDGDNLFQYYDILRNFWYDINVTQIDADGYETAQAARDGVVFNNFSFDINTRQMANVSNGPDMLWVNQTTFVVTSANDTEIKFRYRYLQNIGNNNGGTPVNDQVELKGLMEAVDDPDGAIDSVSDPVYGTDGWAEVTIQTKTPTQDRKMSEFIAYNPNTGLGRTISIISRVPWQYSNAGVWGGNYNFYDQFLNSKERPDWEGYVSNSTNVGQPLTVRFHIEDNIPEALFPLIFTFESDLQNIENNKSDGNANVVSGPSYFASKSGQTTIKYQKTVTWTDYNTELSRENPFGTIIDDDKDGDSEHVVKARFQTIAPITTATTTIRCYNPYIVVKNADGTTKSPYLDVTFTGKSGEAPNYSDQVLDENGEVVTSP